MPSFAFETVDVFAQAPFGGNQLAVFLHAEGLDDWEMQALAAEMNYSETTFVLPPADPAHDARVRIFHRTAEMPFAGHPNVGTAYVLGRSLGGARDRLLFEEAAGIVEARLIRSGNHVTGAEIDAPQSLQIYHELPTCDVAACVGLHRADLVTATHLPVRVSVGVDFIVAEVVGSALSRAAPDRSAFERLAADHSGPNPGRCSILIYCRPPNERMRSRMFAPLAGTWEDPATGSAHAALAAFLLSIDGHERRLSYQALQGEEMGRPSLLSVRAWRDKQGIWAGVGGTCRPIFRGEYRSLTHILAG